MGRPYKYSHVVLEFSERPKIQGIIFKKYGLHEKGSSARFFYKKNFYEKMSLKNPIT